MKLVILLSALTLFVAPAFSAEVSLELSAEAPPPLEAASNVQIPASEIAAIPTQIDSADILRTVPGLQIAQHEGGGKANEYMLRGFYAYEDSRTPFMVTAWGTAINAILTLLAYYALRSTPWAMAGMCVAYVISSSASMVIGWLAGEPV